MLIENNTFKEFTNSLQQKKDNKIDKHNDIASQNDIVVCVFVHAI
jgi:hypothetical protein